MWFSVWLRQSPEMTVVLEPVKTLNVGCEVSPAGLVAAVNPASVEVDSITFGGSFCVTTSRNELTLNSILFRPIVLLAMRPPNHSQAPRIPPGVGQNAFQMRTGKLSK